MASTPPRVRQIRTAVIIWAVATAIAEGVFLLLSPHLIEWGVLPPGASNRSGPVDSVLAIFTIAAIPVFMLVVVFSLYSVFKNGSRIADGLRGTKCNILVRPDEEAAILIRFTQARPIAIDVFSVRAWTDHPRCNRQT